MQKALITPSYMGMMVHAERALGKITHSPGQNREGSHPAPTLFDQ